MKKTRNGLLCLTVFTWYSMIIVIIPALPEQQKNSAVQKEIEKSHLFIYEAYRSKEYQKAATLMKEHLKQSLEYALRCI